MPKCTICKRDIPKGEQFVDITMSSKGNLIKKNYCSEAEFNEYKKEMEYRKLLYDALHDYMGYDEQQIIPNVVNKEISQLHKTYTYRVIYNVVRALEDNIRFAMKKEFSSDFNRGKYLSAILSNNINDTYEKLKREVKIERDRARQHVEIEEYIDIPPEAPKRKVNDISAFLD